ncbi:Phosphatidylinositol 4-kinase lsb6 [Hyphodiscus hymeniophilus]|uniref:Phosphatidylinositol 4-kinase n=1 Tax=Hyphodiscus hymeniophilus TaxID=353542 RepID=A0A9P7AY15_9HELO|nr:Phosphatidylinositol 4-kinase lsb6 [Hyphodiscus hymeniophilus]
MPRNRPPTTGYARIAQAEDSDLDDEGLGNSVATLQPASAPRYASITQPRGHAGMYTDGLTSPINTRRPKRSRRTRSNSSGVDIKAINARLERWADEIASKFKLNKVKGKTEQDEKLEIHHSVFQAPDGLRPATAETLASDADQGRMTKSEFDDIVESVRVAIEQGMHPKMITQGSSGSYFARNGDGKVVGVFKPKDEEPYAAGNPKWNKWIHRNLFPCFFGRACLIPNLSYVSEAAAYTLDCRLRTNLVPYTDIVHLSSKSFHYDFWHRRNFYRKKKAFPPKVGSFQVFLKGFKDANIFLRENPWPDRSSRPLRLDDQVRKKGKPWRETCRPGTRSDDEEEEHHMNTAGSSDEPLPQRFVWTDALQQSFREELEKLVILDYIMRNTDRGLDNWMIKVDWETQDVCIVSEPPQMDRGHDDEPPRLVSLTDQPEAHPYRVQQPMEAISRSATPSRVTAGPTMTVGAIDNSLSWPWKHPDAWRSFPFGWLFLPVSLIGQPFSQKTRDHFLPLLTSKQWWSETQLELRKVFAQDADFQERMFARQIAVMKGQAWNVVETLKLADHGPLELTRRARVCVWDDLVDVPIATPMRMPSAEMRRRHDLNVQKDLDEEMDISAANASAPQPDLLGFATPPADLPNPNRFELASPRMSEDTTGFHSPESPAEIANGGTLKNGQVRFSERPRISHSRNRMSYDGPSRSPPSTLQAQTRRFSFSTRTRGGAQTLYDGDDIEGDLGYAAAEGMEGNQRKVIVERLETVKSKNPVFTWC